MKSSRANLPECPALSNLHLGAFSAFGECEMIAFRVFYQHCLSGSKTERATERLGQSLGSVSGSLSDLFLLLTASTIFSHHTFSV